MYRWGVTPWERYAPAATRTLASLLDRVESDRGRRGGSIGRAVDLGCGRGLFTPELARRGWDATGIDYVPEAIEAARRAGPPEVTYAVGDVTDLAGAGLDPFDLFLDIGCFQGFDAAGRAAQGRGVTALARPGATLLMLAFGPTWLRSQIGGVSQAQVEEAFVGWELVATEPAPTAGLGWPMNRTSPRWYRFELR
ncbi:class I SAM-dependent methyltransferase [Occultella glacieicola]|uniref:Class I SAM-dependent methyltransferase n=2 Tax=Occultella glacieicola TaxID=2518684 RepID=A0ABY2E1F4_9MICO|nr:class I SAM-dependent methyltransferase [Occultella glacieicola]